MHFASANMNLLPLALLAGLIAAAVFLLFAAFDQKRAGKELSRRLAAVQQAESRGSSEALDLLRDELLSDIPALNRLLARTRSAARLQRFLTQADMAMRPGKFLLICLFAGSFLGVVFYLWRSQGAPSCLIGAAAAFLPAVWLQFRRRRRFHKFEEMFPQAIDLLGRAVRAGHAFTTALELIAEELPQPVAGEFRILFEEQKFGLPVREALLNFAERMPLVDVKFFVTAVMLQRETGGNLAEIMDKLSYVIRERFKIHRQVKVYTAQGRLTMMLLMALPPGLVVMMTVIDKNFISVLYTDPIGKLFCVMGIGLQIMGYFMIRKIIRIEV